MSAAWTAVLLVGTGSFALRVLPFVLPGRFAVPDRVAVALRDAGTAAMAALLAAAVLRTDAAHEGPLRLVLWLALVVAAGLALAGRSVTTVILAGAGAYALGAVAASAAGL